MSAVPTSAQIATQLTAAIANHPEVKPLSNATATAYGCHLRRILKAVPGSLDDPAYPSAAEYTKALAEIKPASRPAVAGAMSKWCQVRPGGTAPATAEHVAAELLSLIHI